jgi:hypothetical protein
MILGRAISAIRPRDRRTLVVGFLVVGIAWLGTRGVPTALSSIRSLHERSTAAMDRLNRARAAIAEEPVTRDSFQARARRLVGIAPRLVAGRTSAETSAALAALLGGMATRSKVRITRLELLPDSLSMTFTRCSIRLEAQGDAFGIGRWLAAMEEGTTALAVRRLALAASDPAAVGDRPEVLRVELVVSGWSAPRVEVPTP